MPRGLAFLFILAMIGSETSLAAEELADELLESGCAVCGIGRPESVMQRAIPVGAEEAIAPPPHGDLEDVPGGDLRTLRWVGVTADPVSPEIPFQVAGESVGLIIRAEAATREFEISVELIGPQGEILACRDCPEAPAVGETREGRGSVQMPSTDRPGWELEPGLYRFRVRASPVEGVRGAPVKTNVVLTLRSDVKIDVQRIVDLNFVYLPGSTLSEAIATSSPMFEEFLAQIDERMAPTGVQLGGVTHVDLDMPEFSVIADWTEVGRLFRSSSRTVGRARTLNVYCLEGFDGLFGSWNVRGLSGGIPGPSYSGTRDSGIAMQTTTFLSCTSCPSPYTSLFAHEIGHYFGLYHTTEADLEDEDPLSDTPRCPPDNQNLRTCPDYHNVMFPLIHDANSEWSPGQVRVFQTHPFVRTVPVIEGLARTPKAGHSLRVTAAPNPFREAVRLQPESAFAAEDGVSAAVYDLHGRRVREHLPRSSGFVWDGRNEAGNEAIPGVYFVRLMSATGAQNVRVVKLD